MLIIAIVTDFLLDNNLLSYINSKNYMAFGGAAAFLVSAYYIYLIRDPIIVFMPAVLMVYVIIVLFLVRRKSERQLRHIMHIKGEL